MRDLLRLAVRGAVGSALAAHGAQKAFGWFGGHGPAGTAQFFEGLGFAPGARYATSASYAELAAGIGIVVGLGGPLAPATALSIMIVAAASVHAKNGFFAQNGGYELPFLYGAAAVALAADGYGALSLDGALGIDEADGRIVLPALAGGVAGALIVLAQRGQSQQSETAPA